MQRNISVLPILTSDREVFDTQLEHSYRATDVLLLEYVAVVEERRAASRLEAQRLWLSFAVNKVRCLGKVPNRHESAGRFVGIQVHSFRVDLRDAATIIVSERE